MRSPECPELTLHLEVEFAQSTRTFLPTPVLCARMATYLLLLLYADPAGCGHVRHRERVRVWLGLVLWSCVSTERNQRIATCRITHTTATRNWPPTSWLDQRVARTTTTSAPPKKLNKCWFGLSKEEWEKEKEKKRKEKNGKNKKNDLSSISLLSLPYFSPFI